MTIATFGIVGQQAIGARLTYILSCSLLLLRPSLSNDRTATVLVHDVLLTHVLL